MIGEIERAEQPIESKLFQIVLGYLDELRLDLDLLRTGNARLLHQSIDQFEVIFGIAHNEPAGLRQEMRARTRWENDALAFKKFLCTFAIYKELTAR